MGSNGRKSVARRGVALIATGAVLALAPPAAGVGSEPSTTSASTALSAATYGDTLTDAVSVTVSGSAVDAFDNLLDPTGTVDLHVCASSSGAPSSCDATAPVLEAGVALVAAGGGTATATLDTWTPAAGYYAFVAVYSGDDVYAASTSAATSAIHVSKAALTVTADDAALVAGEAPEIAYPFTDDGFLGTDTWTTEPTCTTTYTSSDPSGTYPITCAGGDAGGNYSVSYVGGSLSVSTAPTTLAYTGDVAGTNGSDVTLSAELVTDADGSPVAGRLVTFRIGDPGPGAQTETATTDAAGLAETTVALDALPGLQPVTADFAGDEYFGASGDASDFAVTDPSAIAYSGDTVGTNGEDVTLSATMTGAGGAPLEGLDVTFTIGDPDVDAQIETATTDASGVASVTVALDAPAGTQPVLVEYEGDDVQDPATDESEIAVTDPVTLTYDGDEEGTNGTTAVFAATLSSVHLPGGIEDQTVTFTLGTGDDAIVEEVVTDADGYVEVEVDLDARAGNRTLVITYDGADGYPAATLEAPFFVWDPTELTYDGSVTGVATTVVELSATLTSVHFPDGVGGKRVVFTLGSQEASARTNGEGVATAKLRLAQPSGPYAVTADFEETGGYESSSDSTVFTITKAATDVVVEAPATSEAGSPITIKIRLRNVSAAVPIGTRTVSLERCSPSTACSTSSLLLNSSGVATTTYTPDRQGTHTFTATFAADATYEGDTGAASSVAALAPTRLRLTTTAAKFRGGFVLTATLTWKDPKPAPGETIAFYRMPSAAATDVSGLTPVATAVTGSNGVASVLYRMDELGSPPAPGTPVYFRAVYAGSVALSPAASPNVTGSVQRRGTALSGTLGRTGSTANLNVTLALAPLTFTTVGAGVPTTTVLTGIAPGQPLVLDWMKGTRALSSLAATTNGSGQVSASYAIPTGATAMRVRFAAANGYDSARTLTLPLP